MKTPGKGTDAAPRRNHTATSSPVIPPTLGLLSLQRTIGNRAAGQLIQRMPTRARVVEQLGQPHANIGIGKLVLKKNSTKYRAVLDALDALHEYSNTRLGSSRFDIEQQLMSVLRRFDTIIEACAAYEDPEEQGADEKTQYFLMLKLRAQNEKTDAIGAMMQAASHPDRWPRMARPTIGTILLTQISDPVVMNEGQRTGQVGGGMNQLQVYSTPGKGSGNTYFKQNMETMDVFANMDEENAAFYAVTSKIPPSPARDQALKPLTVRQNMTDFADRGGISATDTHSAAREVASYRLDLLLDAGMIARTQFALRNVNHTSTLGSAQTGAVGGQAGTLKAARDATDQSALGQGSYNVQDPNFMRLLSRLQLLDTLALQMDRHGGNFFVQQDQAGNVIGITGIDNDMSFGTVTNVASPNKQYPGMSRYVDAELAVKILNLNPELLKLALSDLLTSAEIDAALERLRRLQAHLQQLQSQNALLQPNQWDAAVAQGLLDERRGYQYTQAQRAGTPSRGY